MSDKAPRGVEAVTPYGDERLKGEQVREMFDSIAPAYDFMNRAMTMGIDKLWRRKAATLVARSHPASILDIATGTGDMAIRLARRVTSATVTGVDLSQGMIDIGRVKVESANLEGRVKLLQGDSLDLPFDDNAFDAVTVAYGVRNFQDIVAGYREICRVLKPGGRIVVLELSTPRNPLVKPFYKLYTRCIIPAVGRMVSHDVRAYTYLPESIAAVAQGKEMLALMQRAGFTDTAWRPMTMGVCSLYSAVKP